MGANRMLWGRGKEVRVTNRAELDAALRSADRIVVEGDPALAAYAASLAGAGPVRGGTAPPTMPPAPGQPALQPVAAPDRAAHVANGARPPRLWPWVAGAAVLIAGAGAALVLEHFANPRAVPPHAAPVPPASLAPPLIAPGAASPTSLTSLAWPMVAIVLIAAIYLIARQAIAAGRDVQIAWNVTEKVSGRLVISKVRTRTA